MVDTVTMAQAPYGIEVINRSVGELWVSVNGVTPTVGNAGCDVVMASQSITVSADGDSTNTVQVLGSGNNYSLKCKSGNF